MRRAVLITIAVLIILSILHVVLLGKATNAARAFPRNESTSFVIPAQILKITTLEFDGVAADYLFLKALTFLGSTNERTERPRVKAWEWKWMLSLLETSAFLDPYFFDPYNFSNANLTWGGQLVRETNALLEFGSKYRAWDWKMPFYIGFNEFYFLNENENAARHLMEASRLWPGGGSPLMASLAARLASKERRTETAIMYLEEILEKTDNEFLKQEFEMRLATLKGIDTLEKAAKAYRAKYRKLPSTLSHLVEKGIIAKIPEEPYGGSYTLDKDGTVETTSIEQLLPLHKKRK